MPEQERFRGPMPREQMTPMTGESFSVGLLDVIRLEDGKVAERWVAFDDPEGKIQEFKRKLAQRQAQRQ